MIQKFLPLEREVQKAAELKMKPRDWRETTHVEGKGKVMILEVANPNLTPTTPTTASASETDDVNTKAMVKESLEQRRRDNREKAFNQAPKFSGSHQVYMEELLGLLRTKRFVLRSMLHLFVTYHHEDCGTLDQETPSMQPELAAHGFTRVTGRSRGDLQSAELKEHDGDYAHLANPSFPGGHNTLPPCTTTNLQIATIARRKLANLMDNITVQKHLENSQAAILTAAKKPKEGEDPWSAAATQYATRGIHPVPDAFFEFVISCRPSTNGSVLFDEEYNHRYRPERKLTNALHTLALSYLPVSMAGRARLKHNMTELAAIVYGGTVIRSVVDAADFQCNDARTEGLELLMKDLMLKYKGLFVPFGWDSRPLDGDYVAKRKMAMDILRQAMRKRYVSL